jgi:hypothetical protein
MWDLSSLMFTFLTISMLKNTCLRNLLWYYDYMGFFMWVLRVVCLWLLRCVALIPLRWFDPKYLTIWGKPLKYFNILKYAHFYHSNMHFQKKCSEFFIAPNKHSFLHYLIWPLHTFISRPSKIINQKIVDFFSWEPWMLQTCV